MGIYGLLSMEFKVNKPYSLFFLKLPIELSIYENRSQLDLITVDDVEWHKNMLRSPVVDEYSSLHKLIVNHRPNDINHFNFHFVVLKVFNYIYFKYYTVAFI